LEDDMDALPDGDPASSEGGVASVLHNMHHHHSNNHHALKTFS
jgi:hypothetical protein